MRIAKLLMPSLAIGVASVALDADAQGIHGKTGTKTDVLPSLAGDPTGTAPSTGAVPLMIRQPERLPKERDWKSVVVDKDDNSHDVVDNDDNQPLSKTPPPGTPDDKARSWQARIVGSIQFLDSDGTLKDRCTGWLASASIVVTNAHCLLTPHASVRVTFDLWTATSALEWYPCILEAGGLWRQDDLAALRCGSVTMRPGDRYGFAHLAAASPQRGESLMLTHQYCDIRKDSNCVPVKNTCVGYVLDASYADTLAPGLREFTHDADTLDGSSGAPLFGRGAANANLVVGVHRAGCKQAGNCASRTGPEGKGVYNMAVKVEVLAARLHSIGVF
jgi:hypothetical protein